MYIADLHIHSRYSRATSHDCNPETLELWARKKGIRLFGTGDFTHPAWRDELKEKLVPAEEGLYTLKEEYRLRDQIADDSQIPRFVVTGEISSIYKQDGKVRKVHSLLLLPSLEDAERLSLRLEQIGNIHSDGRPILGLPCHDLLEIMLELCPEAIYIPAHIWTPHFSLFGAFSGFDTIQECFGDLSTHIHALETGLSSDPPMNWRLSALDSYQLISNSDAHSPAKLGREANLIDGELSYPALKKALETGEGLQGTIEFFPEEGKYHFDGHRKCHLCLSPAEALKYDGKCPICGKKLTIGVSHRVEELADRAEGYVRPDGKTFESLVPLPEVIAASTGKSAAGVKVQRMYQEMLRRLGDEFSILRNVPEEDIRLAAGTMIAEGISRLRRGDVKRKPGFDGEYGTIQLFEPWELDNVDGQLSLTLPSQDIAVGTLSEGYGGGTLPEGFGGGKLPEDSGGEKLPEGISETAAPESFIRAEDPDDASSEGAAAMEPEGAIIENHDLPGRIALNENQKEAVTVLARAVSVTAGPGTGKTGTLTARILYLLKERGVKPSEITAVTFTNKAAEELRHRLEKQAGGKKAVRLLNVGTFHSICLELLKENGFERIPAQEEMLLETAGEIVKEYGLAESPSGFLRRLSLEKSGMEAIRGISGEIGVTFYGDENEILENELSERESLERESTERESLERKPLDRESLVHESLDIGTVRGESNVIFHKAASEYQKRLLAEGVCDFDDLLLETLRLFKSEQKKEIGGRRFHYLLVDEFQDVNPIQFELIRLWNSGGKELFVIGDPDQAIYGFRGTDPACFEYLKKEYPSLKEITLNKNYRSVPAILEGAQAVISENPGQRRKLVPMCTEGSPIRLVTAESVRAEAIFAAKEINRLIGGIDMLDAQERRATGHLSGFSDIAVLYRTHRQAAFLETCLRKEGIPYRVAGREDFLEEPAVRGSISFFRSLLNGEERFSAKLSQRLLWSGMGKSEREAAFERAAETYFPLMKRGKPYEILDKWIADQNLDNQNMDKLMQLSGMYRNMKEFTDALAFGTEGDLIRPGKKQYRSDAVTLMTMHASKGLEFPVVILCGVRKGLIPLEMKGRSWKMDKEEERRLFYVGMTRAREQLILVTDREQSEFLDALPDTCLEREDAGRLKQQESGMGRQISLFEWMKEQQ